MALRSKPSLEPSGLNQAPVVQGETVVGPLPYKGATGDNKTALVVPTLGCGCVVRKIKRNDAAFQNCTKW